MPNPANKLTIAIDADDVLAAHAQSFIEFSNERYGTKFDLEKYHESWSTLWGINREETERRAREFYTTRSVANYELIQEADKSILSLAEKSRLFLVTARMEMNVKPTHAWIAQYFPGVFEGVHFVPIWETNNKVTKAEICQQIGADYLIDDLPRHCNVAADAGIKALLFGDYSWNRNEEIIDGVTRVKNWQEVLGYFDA